MSRQSRHGEANFAAICQDQEACADAVVNKASDDLHGWDHVIDIEPPKNTRLPADLQTHLFQCFAQIKTTNGRKPRTKLKLSNAIKAAKSPLPSFVFLFHYVSSSSKPKLYGRHIWKYEISHYLKRAREADINRKIELHKQAVLLNFTEEDRLDGNPIDWILNILSKYGGESYAVRKAELIATVGYGEFTHEGKVTFGPLNSVGDVVLHELGLIKDLPIENFRLFDKRFGIISKEPLKDFSGGRLSFTREGKKLTFQIISNNGTSFDIPALAWIPTTVSLGHPEFRARIKAGHINLVAKPGSNKQQFELNYNLAGRHTFLEQLGLLCLINWSKIGPLKYKVQTEIGEMFSGQISGRFQAEPWTPQLEMVGHHLVELLGREKCGDVSLSFAEFSKLNREMNYVASIFSSRHFRFDAVFENMIEPFEKLLGYFYGELGPWTFGVIYEFKHETRSNEGLRQTFYFSNPRIVSKFAFQQPLSTTKKQIRREFIEYRKTLDTPTATLQDGDLVSWTKALMDEGLMELSVD
ncbi:hypothetical protein [Roseibium sp.]|uniref:hypothetical protein n=1 Tax=Roseibium sp. TaxID=1936156 RepID=UPI003A974754